MSDRDTISSESSGGGNAIPTKLDNVFGAVYVPSKFNTASSDKNSTLITWQNDQTTAGAIYRGHENTNIDSPSISNSTEFNFTFPSNVQNEAKSTPPKSTTQNNISSLQPRFIDGIDVSTLRHFVITIKNEQQHMPNKIWATTEHDHQRHGLVGMLHLVLWANVYLLEDPQNEFWKQVECTASERVPRNLNCEVLVKGNIEKVFRVFKKQDLLVHEGNHFFNRESFYFSFREGVFLWQFYGDKPDLHGFLVREGISTVEKSFKRVYPIVPKPWYP
jgi:hypothetical protein